jgi:2-polyprenyl-6-methoxyphenol hydroxylase-like FAD-dependent oxidoreductase
MVSKPATVAIIGGGLSGLCLAHALVRGGFKVTVFEKDSGPDIRGQGYRLTIDPIGSQALRACLPPTQYEFIRSTGGKTDKVGAFIFLDERARELHRFRFDVEANERRGLITGQVDRQVFRRGLLSGITDHVHFGRAFSRYEERGDRVIAWFDDGSSAEADLLIGADGVNSVVRRQRLPAADPPYTGSSAIFGRTRVGNVRLPVLQRFLDCGGTTALGPHGRAFFCATMRFREDPAIVAARLGLDIGPIAGDDYMMWAAAFRQDRVGALGAASLDPAMLHQIALREIEGFQQDFRALVEKSDPNDAVLVPIKAMPRLRPWHASRITLIGDAIHAMPPFGAHGANTSLEDAQILAAALTRSAGSSLACAIASYESNMRTYSYKAIGSACRSMKLATADFPFKRAMLLATLRIAGVFSR